MKLRITAQQREERSIRHKKKGETIVCHSLLAGFTSGFIHDESRENASMRRPKSSYTIRTFKSKEPLCCSSYIMHTAFNRLSYVLNDIEIPTSHPAAGAPAVDWCVPLCVRWLWGGQRRRRVTEPLEKQRDYRQTEE